MVAILNCCLITYSTGLGSEFRLVLRIKKSKPTKWYETIKKAGKFNAFGEMRVKWFGIYEITLMAKGLELFIDQNNPLY